MVEAHNKAIPVNNYCFVSRKLVYRIYPYNYRQSCDKQMSCSTDFPLLDLQKYFGFCASMRI
jgi:hypothetical protein